MSSAVRLPDAVITGFIASHRVVVPELRFESRRPTQGSG
jgi:hypothetical protein